MMNKFSTAYFNTERGVIETNIFEALNETDAMMRSILHNTASQSQNEYYREWFNEIKHYRPEIFKKEMEDLGIFCTAKPIQ
jgi:hypothetical protein